MFCKKAYVVRLGTPVLSSLLSFPEMLPDLLSSPALVSL